jgi:hypothetical protein
MFRLEINMAREKAREKMRGESRMMVDSGGKYIPAEANYLPGRVNDYLRSVIQ